MSTSSLPYFSVIIAGAGPTGLAMGNLLGMFGIDALILEQNAESVIVTVRAPGNVVKRIECAYLLACDGGKSGIRRALDIPMLGSTYAQKWLVIDTLDDRDPSPIAKFFCNPSRPAVTVPAP